jgi:uncharacterized RDD family membrane protein YckC
MPMLDTLRRVETPEGVELSLPVAGPFARARAWVYDLLIKVIVSFVAAIALAFLGDAGAGLFMILLFALSWLYPVLFEVLADGATPGKKMVGLRVVHDDGMPVGWSAALIRSVIGFVDMLPVGYAVGLTASLLNTDFKRLGDMAAGTVVIHTVRPRQSSLALDVPPARPPWPLLIEEQHGLVEFAARSSRLTHERQEELAGIAVPLTTAGSSPVRQLLAQARWISGDR